MDHPRPFAGAARSRERLTPGSGSGESVPLPETNAAGALAVSVVPAPSGVRTAASGGCPGFASGVSRRPLPSLPITSDAEANSYTGGDHARAQRKPWGAWFAPAGRLDDPRRTSSASTSWERQVEGTRKAQRREERHKRKQRQKGEEPRQRREEDQGQARGLENSEGYVSPGKTRNNAQDGGTSKPAVGLPRQVEARASPSRPPPNSPSRRGYPSFPLRGRRARGYGISLHRPP